MEEDFLAAIITNPGDDNLKLVYADWLDDLGDSRGQLIRLSVEMRKILREQNMNHDKHEWLEDLRIHQDRPLIVKRFGRDFHSEGGALTLSTGEVCEDDSESGYHWRRHDDGWIIRGEIHEDYYTWVNDFEAEHQKFGRVWGNFEGTVYADCEAGFQDLYAKHQPQAWDYQDI